MKIEVDLPVTLDEFRQLMGGIQPTWLSGGPETRPPGSGFRLEGRYGSVLIITNEPPEKVDE